MALVMSAGVVFAQTTLKPSADVPGVHIANEAANAWTGAVVVLGSGTDAWPWSAAGDGAAFTPVPGATYRVAATITSSGLSALRVRWGTTSGPGYPDFTTADAAAVSANVFTADQIADKVPAYFSPNVIASGETKTFLLDVTMDGSAVAGGLVGNLVFIGGAGSNAFTVDKIVITDAAGNQLVNYDANPPAGPVVLPPSATWPGVSVLCYADGNAQSGANIILTDKADTEWPFAAAGADGLVAFTPVQDAVYRMVFSVESTGVTGFRVRWLTGNSGETYTADGDYVNAAAYTFTADQIADKVPAYFQNTISTGEIKTYTLDIPMGAARPFIGNLALRGAQGNNDYYVRTLQFFAPNGDMLVNYLREDVQSIPQVNPNKYNAYGIEGGIVVKANENVSIFSFDGRLVKQAMGGQTIPMEKGLYIVKTATQADKVIVK